MTREMMGTQTCLLAVRAPDIWALPQARPLRQEGVPIQVSKTILLGVCCWLVLPRLSGRAPSESDLHVARLWKHRGGSPEGLVLVSGLFGATPVG